MANTAPDFSFETTWNAFPSLLSTLTDVNLREAIEAAVCAHQCGRHADADALFEEKLLQGTPSPFIVLVRADMLTNVSREGERNDLLRSIKPSPRNNLNTATKLLLELMLADSDYWTFGRMEPCLEVLYRMRAYISACQMSELTDIQIRCITLYYDVTNNLMLTSNELSAEDTTCWKRYAGDRYEETQAIRMMLQSQARWRFAPTFMQLELKNIKTQQQFQTSASTAYGMLDVMGRMPAPAIRYRAVVVASQLGPMLPPQLAEDVRQKKIGYLQALAPDDFSTWELWCPQMASTNAEEAVLQTAMAPLEKFALLQVQIDELVTVKAYTRANQIYISTRNMLNDALAKDDTNKGVLDVFQEHSLAYVRFHQELTRMVWFESAGIADYLSSDVVHRSSSHNILSMVEDFDGRHPDMQIPLLLERLYGLAVPAATSVGDQVALKTYTGRHKDALSRCPFTPNETKGLTDDAVLNPDYAHRVMTKDGDDAIAIGINALKLMLLWAAEEIRSRVSTMAEIEHAFGVKIDPRAGKLSSMITHISVKTLFADICGKVSGLTTTEDFLQCYQRLHDWTVLPNRRPSTGPRLYALRYLVQARIYLFRLYLIDRKALPEARHIQSYEQEVAILAELSMEEQRVAGKTSYNDTTDPRAMSVRNMLMRCANPEIRASLSLYDLDRALATSRELITEAASRSAQLWVYNHLGQTIQLLWWRMLQFGSDDTVKSDTEKILVEVQAADAVQKQIRQQLEMPQASRSLAAAVAVNDQFRRSEHYLFAFAALQKRVLVFSSQPSHRDELQHATNSLADWSIRSKGQGLIASLLKQSAERDSVDAGRQDTVAAAGQDLVEFLKDMVITEPAPESDLDASLPPVSSDDIHPIPAPAPVSAITTSYMAIQAMVDLMEEEVIIIDVVDIVRGVKGCYSAIVYQRKQPIQLVDLEVGSPAVEAWVRDHLDTPGDDSTGKIVQERQLADGKGNSPPAYRPLSTQRAAMELEHLKGFIGHLIGTTGKVILPAGVTLIWCLTGALHRVPIQALLTPSGPLARRNPLVFTQSLSLMHTQWLQSRTVTVSTCKKVILNPLPPDWESSNSARTVYNMLSPATILHGTAIRLDEALYTMQESTIFNYQGHVAVNSGNPLETAMVLSQNQRLSVRKIMDSAALNFPALCTILACASGVARITNTDDMLSIPAALHRAGASSVLSTLWPIDDADGARLGRLFYRRLILACQDDRRGDESIQIGRDARMVNLAKILQAAILEGYGGLDESQLPYHWASFFMQGIPFFPVRTLRGRVSHMQ